MEDTLKLKSQMTDLGSVPAGIMVRRSITRVVNVVGMKFNAMYYSFFRYFPSFMSLITYNTRTELFLPCHALTTCSCGL